ncbi:DNA cytosine methyltransferase [Nostoc sp.]|uniref:DNA cytosine methyltransferase n=1 Tax=Nostoc sp. TaxID=1180 RepID=UPI003FA58246
MQTFPDDFVFCGSSARQFTQVGNAVPPLIAFQLARSIYFQIYTGQSRYEVLEPTSVKSTV